MRHLIAATDCPYNSRPQGPSCIEQGFSEIPEASRSPVSPSNHQQGAGSPLCPGVVSLEDFLSKPSYLLSTESGSLVEKKFPGELEGVIYLVQCTHSIGF